MVCAPHQYIVSTIAAKHSYEGKLLSQAYYTKDGGSDIYTANSLYDSNTVDQRLPSYLTDSISNTVSSSVANYVSSALTNMINNVQSAYSSSNNTNDDSAYNFNPNTQAISPGMDTNQFGNSVSKTVSEVSEFIDSVVVGPDNVTDVVYVNGGSNEDNTDTQDQATSDYFVLSDVGIPTYGSNESVQELNNRFSKKRKKKPIDVTVANLKDNLAAMIQDELEEFTEHGPELINSHGHDNVNLFYH